MVKIFKKVFNFMFSRLFLVALMLLIQIALIVAVIVYFQSVLTIYVTLHLISFLVVIGIFSNSEHPAYQMTWITFVLIFPLTGGIFYLFFGNKRIPAKLKRRINNAVETTRQHMDTNHLCDRRLRPGHPHLARQSSHIYNMAGYPLCENTSSTYFPVGEDLFERLVSELKQAKRFIFLEFFIIRPGHMWDTIFDILKQKVREGVEVRLLYDDLGCINTLPKGYDRIIRRAGIRLSVFNPFRPRVNVLLNCRDHRKIVVIDGKTAFCGGVNLADEYINRMERFGHWKDTGVMLKGDAVWSFTYMYLEQWQFSTMEEVDYDAYRAESSSQPSDGLVQVFCDSPLDNINITEIAYLNIINRATRYVYITTPYLIIDHEMEQALCTAAESGIDVRIITPYRYDKWFVHTLTRTHYAKLIRSGVKIFEYTPGFMHGKMFVSDDKVCMVGTCNMDFRSFFLHFECSVTFYKARLIRRVKKDMLTCQQLSHRISLEESETVPLHIRVIQALLKVFAPLM